jgi:hypothetical protein
VITSSIELLAEGTAATTSLLSIGAQLAFGGGLFYGVQKFFEEVEKKLSDNTKLEIAIWLLDLHPSKSFGAWRETFVKIFERVFGDKQLSWKCLWRSCAATAITSLITLGATITIFRTTNALTWSSVLLYMSASILSSFIPDYLSLWKTRYLINASATEADVYRDLLLLLLDIIGSLFLAACASLIGMIIFAVILASATDLYHSQPIFRLVKGLWYGLLHDQTSRLAYAILWFIPAFFGRLWLLSYVASGRILKVAHHLDIGFVWFNEKFDVESHPLQSIGLVAGTVCALGYWLLALIHLVP